MTRTHQNPMKGELTVPPPPEISLCMVTHYTDDRYHEYRKPIVDLCVRTMLDGAYGKDYEFIVWDNGSIDSFRAHLLTYKPTKIILSNNVGKSSARRGLAQIARGDIFCFSDDDILYYPGWLDAQLDILHHFPSPVLVSGSPQRTAFRHDMSAVNRFVQQYKAKLTRGRLLQDDDEMLYAISIGKPWEQHKWQTASFLDYLIEYNGMKVWAHGHHMQFVTWRDEIVPHMRESITYLDNERVWEDYLDSVGFLRLTTYNRTVWHLGNELDGKVSIVDGNLKLNKQKEG